MDFENSSQAKYWMYDEHTLNVCRTKASVVQSSMDKSASSHRVRVRKFACGFKNPTTNDNSESGTPLSVSDPKAVRMLPLDQETLIHFHAHQIQRLVGPNAIFPQLRRSASVLSTAIMIFRRFYLSNSVIDFHPRSIATASAHLALKVDCEPLLEIELLSHATAVINRKAQKAALCRDELRAVSIMEIEAAERHILEGLDYRLRCHHPYGAIKVLAADIVAYLRNSQELLTKCYGHGSPRTVFGGFPSDGQLDSLWDRALAVAQSALVYSDVSFLFQPGKIAFAAVAIALEGRLYGGGRLGCSMRHYLRMRFPQKSSDELSQFEFEVTEIIRQIESCPAIDLSRFSGVSGRRSSRTTEIQANEVRRVFSLVARLRKLQNVASATVAAKEKRSNPIQVKRKRGRADCHFLSSQPPRKYKAARVTPIQNPMF